MRYWTFKMKISLFNGQCEMTTFKEKARIQLSPKAKIKVNFSTMKVAYNDKLLK